MARAWGLLQVAVFPAACFACGEALGPRHTLGACPACWARLRPLAPPLCPRCGLPRPEGTDLLGPAGGRCPACVIEPPAVVALRAGVPYDDVARRFLLRAKFGARRELLTPLGLRLAAILRAERFAARCESVVPVPSHRWTDLRRGFSPSRELARVVGRELRIPVRTALLARRWLGGEPSKKLRIQARMDRGRDPFRCPGPVPPERILLIDDVMTTGATLERCARALLARGASEVLAAVWARALPRNGHSGPGKIA